MLRKKDLFTIFFSTFYMDHLGKICPHLWKERLKSSIIAEFESDRSLLVSKDVALQSCENL